MRVALAAALAVGAAGCGRPCSEVPVLEGACGGRVIEGVPTVLRFTAASCDGTSGRVTVPMAEVLSSDPRVFTVAEQRTDAGIDYLLIAGTPGTARVIADRGPDYLPLEYALTADRADAGAGAADAGQGCAPVEPLTMP